MYKFIIKLWLLLFLTACSVDNSLTPIPKQGVILAFGDSLTFGKGVQKQYSYPAILAKLSKHQVINAGISGETTAGGLKRFQKTLDKYQPDLVLLLEGGNDILRSLDLAKTKQNLAKMIKISQQNKITVILFGVPKRGIFLRTADFYEQLADEYNLIFIEDLIAILLADKKYKSDLIHFNKLGYQMLAQQVYEILLDNQLLIKGTVGR